MNFETLREQLRRAREQAPVERKGVPRIGMTLDEASAASGLNRATVHSIENVRREPTLKPELETVERLVLAYGMTLSSFFARVEGLSEAVAVSDNIEPRPETSDEALPAFESEERIAQNVFRLFKQLAREGLPSDENTRPADHRLPSTARPLAAERRAHPRTPRRRTVPAQTKDRRKKQR